MDPFVKMKRQILVLLVPTEVGPSATVTNINKPKQTLPFDFQPKFPDFLGIMKRVLSLWIKSLSDQLNESY